MKTNCPNCGAPIESAKCPYCGTLFYDMTVIDLQNPGYVRFRYGDRIIQGRMYPGRCSITTEPVYSACSCRDVSGMILRAHMTSQSTINLELISIGSLEVIVDA